MQESTMTRARGRPGILAVSALIVSLCFVSFSVLVVTSRVSGLDTNVSRLFFFRTLESPSVLIAMLFVSNIEMFMPVVAFGAAGVLWRRGYRQAAILAAIALMGFSVVDLLKLVLQRPCPGPLIGEARLWSYMIKGALGLPDHSPFCYPSGHVGSYVMFWGYVGHLVGRFENRPWQRRLVRGGIALLLLLVGPSRIYLGAHWLSDVIGGYLVGAAGLLLLMIAEYGLGGRRDNNPSSRQL